MENDTIAAIATAMNNSGIGIVRISGEEALTILSRIFYPSKKKLKVCDIQSHSITYGCIKDGGQMIDEVLVMYMKEPHSYTAEDTVEIDCHGGVFAVKKVLEAVLKNGARPAEAGEFTKRAFLNGRIDLSQAEAVMELIGSENDYALKSSLRQLKGSVLKEINRLRKTLLYEAAYIESALDDPEHISLEGCGDRLKPIVKEIEGDITRLIDSADNGRMISEGVKTVILGRPNAGKSSVLNLLLGEERAIVTEVAGTTRDTIEEHLTLGNISLNLVDTAGIRDAENIVEKIGVERAVEQAEGADLILYVVDSSEELSDDDERILKLISDRKAIVLLNKSDLEQLIFPAEMEKRSGKTVINFSAKEGKGLDELEGKITEMFFADGLKFNDEIYITSARQKNALYKARESMRQAEESIDAGFSEEFYSADLMEAYDELGYVTGESTDEDLINEIFGRFCMGK